MRRQHKRDGVRSPDPARPDGHRAGRLLAGAPFLAAALALNWIAAATAPDRIFSLTSFLLFGWTMLFVARVSARGAILLAPVAITRLATLVSLAGIEAGAYMPEVNRLGAAGDASASFAAVTALFFVAFAVLFRAIERPLAAGATSRTLDTLAGALGWPVVAGCAAWGGLAFLHGLHTGFPLIEGVDRFYYRRFLGDGVVKAILDNKLILAGLIGAIVAAPATSRPLRATALALMLALTALYFLFGDKFFTILTEVSVFAMPLLLPRSRGLGPILLRAAPIGAAVLALAGAATIYIYSDYGRLPADRTMQHLGERIAGEGELWFVATRDYARPTGWDEALVQRYGAVLADDDLGTAAFRHGVETYFFVQRYAPAKLAASFRRNQGWVQLTMGTEAMALVMFGYAGVAIVMLAAAALLALAAAYLSRAFRSGFPPSLFFAIWAYLQVYFAVQQAALGPVAAPGQAKRFLLFLAIEIGLFAVNRAETRAGRWRRTMAPA